jgi:hypothetical protein
MLGRDLLVFPDTGEEFTRTVRTSALYADRVHCLTIFGAPDRNKQMGAIMRRFRKTAKNLTPLQIHGFERMEKYGDFTKDAGFDLIAAKKAGILVPISPSEDVFDSLREGCRKFRQAPLSERQWSPLANRLVRAADLCPPSLFDMEFLCEPVKGRTDFETVRQGLFFKYLLGLIELAEVKELTLTSWSPIFRSLIWDLQKALGSSVLSSRDRTTARTSQVVFDRRLPRVDDLPLDEILKIRERRKDELESFRTAIAELSLKIDGTQSHERVERQIRDLVTLRIDPAIRKLRSAVAISRLDAIKRVFKRSWTSIAAKATLPAVLSYLGSGRTEMSATAAVAALGVVVLPVVEAEIDRRKALKNSPWSLLLRLK